MVILTVFYLQMVSCGDNPNITNPPAQATNEADPKYLVPGQYQKTQGYNFQEGFIFHEWKGEEAIIKYIPFNFRDYKPYKNSYAITSPAWAIKKIVSSKYFDIYVDITPGQPAYKKALTLKDTTWDKLIKDLEIFYPKIVSIYGTPTDIDGNKKIEIVFHENAEYGMTEQHGGYFNDANVTKGYYNTGNMDIIYVSSYHYIQNHIEEFSEDAKRTIIHELQHDIDFQRGNYRALYCYNEALSESTYTVILNNKYSVRGGDFSGSRNGKYFFDWKRNSQIISANYITAMNFMYWLYIHGGGEKIIKDIVSISKSKYKPIDHKSIGEAASRNILDFANENHNTVIYWWYRANFYNNASGIFGYQNRVKINLYLANTNSGRILLKPQCAVYTTQDMFDKNKNIPNIKLSKLSDGRRNWLLIFNWGDEDRTVYINPSAATRMQNIISYNEEKKSELYDQVFYLDEYEKFEGDNMPPKEINE